eukprot:3983275-Heterocapsa_arctica.AAC.1
MFQDIKKQRWVKDASGPARQAMEKMCAEFRKGPAPVAAAPSIPGGGAASSTTERPEVHDCALGPWSMWSWCFGQPQ